MKALQPFFIALQFLTRLPVRLSETPDERTVGRSLLYYPVVGLIVGAALAALNIWLQDAPSLLRAALLLTAWVVLTGALHLDGLADSADAWIGGIGDRARTLAIMKDPHCGPAAVVAITLALFLKFAALHALHGGDHLILLSIPILARSSTLLLFLTTPYVRPGGIGAALASAFPRVATGTVVVATCAALVWMNGLRGCWLLLAFGGTFALLRYMMMRRIGGTTGDTAGAVIELSETVTLVTAAMTTN